MAHESIQSLLAEEEATRQVKLLLDARTGRETTGHSTDQIDICSLADQICDKLEDPICFPRSMALRSAAALLQMTSIELHT